MSSFTCDACNYSTHHKGTYVNHCNSKKHKMKTQLDEIVVKKQEEINTIQQLTQQVLLLTQLVQQVVNKEASNLPSSSIAEHKEIKIKKKTLTFEEEKENIERALKTLTYEEKINYLEKYKSKTDQIKKYVESRMYKCVSDFAIPQLEGSRW
jgi:hypothetical protein